MKYASPQHSPHNLDAKLPKHNQTKFSKCLYYRMLSRKEDELVKRQTVERRALPKRIRAERKARDMMFRESLRISSNLDPDGERDKLKKV